MFPRRRCCTSFLTLEKNHVIVKILSFYELNPYIIWLGKNVSPLFNKKCQITSSFFLNFKTTFRLRSANISCAIVSIVQWELFISIPLLLFQKKWLFVLYISKFRNFEPIHRKLRNTCEIRFNKNDLSCQKNLILSTRQFPCHVVFYFSKICFGPLTFDIRTA